VAPYQHRLDWQMWFVGNGAGKLLADAGTQAASARGESIAEEPWLVHLVWQLLKGESSPKALLARDPFPNEPPRWLRAGIWRYRFSAFSTNGAWWTRDRVGEFLPPVSLHDPGLREYVAEYGWPDADPL
jgi:hypothetical protein